VESFVFSVLTLLVGYQKGHLVCKDVPPTISSPREIMGSWLNPWWPVTSCW